MTNAPKKIELGDVVELKKKHACGSFDFTVIRVGADIKLKCLGCGRIIMLEREIAQKRIKKIKPKD